jgi:hypothetical protein
MILENAFPEIYTLPGVGNFIFCFQEITGRNNHYFHLNVDVVDRNDIETTISSLPCIDLPNEMQMNLFTYPSEIGKFILKFRKRDLHNNPPPGEDPFKNRDLYCVLKLNEKGIVTEREYISSNNRGCDSCAYLNHRNGVRDGKNSNGSVCDNKDYSRDYPIHISHTRDSSCVDYFENVVFKIVKKSNNGEWKIKTAKSEKANEEVLKIVYRPFCENSKFYYQSIDDDNNNYGDPIFNEVSFSSFSSSSCSGVSEKLEEVKHHRKVKLPSFCDVNASYTENHSATKDYLLLCFEHFEGDTDDSSYDYKNIKYKFVLLNFLEETSRIIHVEKHPTSKSPKSSNYPISMAVNTSIYDFHFSRKVSETLFQNNFPKDLINLLASF